MFYCQAQHLSTLVRPVISLIGSALPSVSPARVAQDEDGDYVLSNRRGMANTQGVRSLAAAASIPRGMEVPDGGLRPPRARSCPARDASSAEQPRFGSRKSRTVKTEERWRPHRHCVTPPPFFFRTLLPVPSVANGRRRLADCNAKRKWGIAKHPETKLERSGNPAQRGEGKGGGALHRLHSLHTPCRLCRVSMWIL